MGGGEREFERFQVDIVEGGKCEGLFFRLFMSQQPTTSPVDLAALPLL